MGGKEKQTPELGCVALAQRLRRRQGEIERALTRGCGEGESGVIRDPKQRMEVDAAYAAVTEYNIACLERGEDVSTPIPSAAIALAREAARGGNALDVFLLRVISAQTLLSEFVIQEVGDLAGKNLSEVQMLQGSILLQLVSELAGEFKREQDRLNESFAQRQSALVEQLLSGSPGAVQDVGYPMGVWHVGLVVTGPTAMDASRVLAESLGTALLAVPRDGRTVWAWLGSNGRLPSRSVQDSLTKNRRGLKAKFAVGEPGEDLEGWRSTHFEAKAALGVAIHRSANVTRFSDVALEAIALQMPDLVRSLQTVYLDPLAAGPRRGSTLRQTLRAYFVSGRNVSSAAVTLRVSRRTVENRLHAIEQELGRSLIACGAELELALRLEELNPSVGNVSR